MNLSLEANEVNFILAVLDELPSKTGAFLLTQKIRTQQAAEDAGKEKDKE